MVKVNNNVVTIATMEGKPVWKFTTYTHEAHKVGHEITNAIYLGL